MLIKSSRHIPRLIPGLLLSGIVLVAYSNDLEQEDRTYPEGESYSEQQTTDENNTPNVESNSSVKHDRVEKTIVKIPVSDQGNRNKLNLPIAGMSKDDVESEWGQPNTFRNAVGNPPISSWKYDDFTVYFEHGHVIRSVIKPIKIE